MPGLGKKVEVLMRTGSHYEKRNDRMVCKLGVQLAPENMFSKKSESFETKACLKVLERNSEFRRVALGSCMWVSSS